MPCAVKAIIGSELLRKNVGWRKDSIPRITAWHLHSAAPWGHKHLLKYSGELIFPSRIFRCAELSEAQYPLEECEETIVQKYI